jgi:hypothetical protein
MAIKLEAYVDKTPDGGLECYDRVGAIVVHIDGDTMVANPATVKLVKIADATEHLGPMYAIEIPETLPITVQHWNISSIRQGQAQELIESPADM